jgi:hypothetical protein
MQKSCVGNYNPTGKPEIITLAGYQENTHYLLHILLSGEATGLIPHRYQRLHYI